MNHELQKNTRGNRGKTSKQMEGDNNKPTKIQQHFFFVFINHYLIHIILPECITMNTLAFAVFKFSVLSI